MIEFEWIFGHSHSKADWTKVWMKNYYLSYFSKWARLSLMLNLEFTKQETVLLAMSENDQNVKRVIGWAETSRGK